MPLKPNLHRFFKFTCNDKYSNGDLDRYIPKIDTTPGLGPKGDCWEWKGHLVDGYGVFTINKNGKQIHIKAHRAAVEMATNTLIPDSQCVLHKCDNRKCVKAYLHLFLGTHQDNMKDMINKGRQAHQIGEKSSSAIHTWIEINEIRTKWLTGKYTHKQLGKIYNIYKEHIGKIIRNEIWYDKNYIPNKSLNHYYSKLTMVQVNNIRKDWNTGKYNIKQLSEEYMIDKSVINRIVNNKIWKR